MSFCASTWRPAVLMMLVLVIIPLAACSGVKDTAELHLVSTAIPVESSTVEPTATVSQPSLTETPSYTATPSVTLTQVPSTEIVEPIETIAPTKFPDPAAYSWQPVVSGLNTPVGLVHAGDDSGRLFVLEQSGRVRILHDGVLPSGTFLDISERVGSRGSEQGLLGLAFHPDYTQNGYFYINYTDLNGDTVIARFSVMNDNPDLADASSEYRLLSVRQPYGNHNGGMLAFGLDGYLYAGLGDGGSAGDPQNNGQSLDTLLGKILRLDVDGGLPYVTPPDNPFVDGSGRPEIWAFGLRNPWRFAFDRLTGDLYIGDVGQNQWEEIDFLAANSPGGANFGWSYYEGRHIYSGAPAADLNLVSPVAEYSHDQGCSVTGGVVYRGQTLPEWQGIYLFGDYCTGRVWGLLRMSDGLWLQQVLFENLGQISSFGEDQAGEIYYVDHSGGIYRLAVR